MSVGYYVLAALGLAVLMVVHEGGHYLAARRFGMRVVKFSIGFGPTLWKHQPKDSPTTYQVALIPFLAYVQIAGMNPYEDNDPKDKGSYLNASLWGRIVTIAAGPLTNYLFASVLIFVGYLMSGLPNFDSLKVVVNSGGGAEKAGMVTGDKIISVKGEAIDKWENLVTILQANPGEELPIVIERNDEQLTLQVTPAPVGDENAGRINVGPERMPISLGEAAKLSLIEPPTVVYNTVVGIGRLITGKDKPDFGGPVRIVKTTAQHANSGPGELLKFLGWLSAYLGAFNLLPFPALDGGRLMFLMFEAIARKKPNAKVEARVHMVGLLLLLGVLFVVTYFDLAPKK